ncbi:MAG: transposase [Promethearchaeota archaeon]
MDGALSRNPNTNKLITVLNNARSHHSKWLNEFLESHESRLELLFLPKNSPDLNPLE